MDAIEASCNCGAVTVRATAPALMQFYCHCDDCQRATGAPYIGVAVFPAGAVSVHGETDAWTLRTLPRHRCRACGTQMIGEVPGGELVGIRADRLPAGAFDPRFHINCRYAQLPVRDALTHYAGIPPELGGDDDARVAW